MINTNDKNKDMQDTQRPADKYVDTATLDVQLHIIIKDKDTGEVLVNKRG